MISGRVQDRFTLVVLEVSGQTSTAQVEFIVDTAYEGEIALPLALIRRVGASFGGRRSVLLADRSPRFAEWYLATIEWQGEERMVEVDALDGHPLLGNFLLDGNHLQIEHTPGGDVLIETL